MPFVIVIGRGLTLFDQLADAPSARRAALIRSFEDLVLPVTC